MNFVLSVPLFLEINERPVRRYVTGLLIAYAALLLFAIWVERIDLIATCVIAPCALLLVAFPRVVLTIFGATMFINLALFFNTTLMLSDFSGLLVIATALVDVLVSKTVPRSFPRLTFYFVTLLVVIFIASLASSRPELGTSSFLRLILLIAVFLSVFRLTGKTGIAFPVKLFFWLCALFSLPALYSFVTTGGASRSFGLTHQVLDDFTMLAIPLGLALYLFAKPGKGYWYLFGIVFSAAGLIATQSRLSIMLAVAHSALLLLFVWWQFRKTKADTSDNLLLLTKSRLKVLFISALACALLLFALKPELFLGVFKRFDVALGGGRLGDSYVPRLALWTAAYHAFLDHPLLGIGPGNFRAIIDLYPELSLNYYYFWVRGFSSHNLFLHYLAETGIVGATAVIALFVAGFRYSWQGWKAYRRSSQVGVSLGILAVACMFLVTAFVEAGWMWGQTAFAMTFFMAVIARQRESFL